MNWRGSMPPDRSAPENDAQLSDLLIEIRRIRELLERANARAHALNRPDRVRLERLLPAIAGTFGSEPFTSRDLLDEGGAAIQVALSGTNARQVGRLLRRGEGHVLDGYV